MGTMLQSSGAAGRRGYAITATSLGRGEFLNGSALAVGDFNGNGSLELVINEPVRQARNGVLVLGETRRGPSNSGGKRVWSGDARVIDGVVPASRAFGAVAATGDFNGDGYDDLVVGDPGFSPPADPIGVVAGAGEVQVIPGSRRGVRPRARLRINIENGLPADLVGQFGATLAVDDFNLDGYDDLVVGAPDDAVDNGGPTPVPSGSVSVFAGSPSGLSTTPLATFTLATLNVDIQFDEQFGTSLATGDISGDGWPDLVIAGWPYVNGDRRGRAYVLFSQGGGGIGISPRTPQSYVTPFRDGTSSPPISALAVGDMNADGFADLVVGDGARFFLDGGQIHVVPGALGGLLPSARITLSQDGPIADEREPDDLFGYSLAVGDIDGDEYDDLLVGAPGERNGEEWGLLHVLHGSASGVTTDGNWTIDQSTPGVVGSGGGEFAIRLLLAQLNPGAGLDLVVAAPSWKDRGIIHIQPSVAGLRPVS